MCKCNPTIKTPFCGKPGCEWPTQGKIEVLRDTVAEKLDEMADICEYWKRNREKGHTPNAIRTALLMMAEELRIMGANAKVNGVPPNGTEQER